MNEEAIVQALETLAAKLGVTDVYLWEVLVAQAQVELVNAALVWGFTLVLAFSTAGIFGYMHRNDIPIGDSAGPSFGGIVGILLAAMTAFFFVKSIGVAFGVPTLLMNPEYWALNEILETIR